VVYLLIYKALETRQVSQYSVSGTMYWNTELEILSFKSQLASYQLQVLNSGFIVLSSGLQVLSFQSQVISYQLPVLSFGLLVSVS